MIFYYLRFQIIQSIMRYKLYILLLLISLNGLSQNISELALVRNIRQDNQNSVFKITDEVQDKKLECEQDKTYYWFKNQLVIATKGSWSGHLLHGMYESFYDNKQLSSQGVFQFGLKHGKWLYWNAKGIIIHTEDWNRGLKIGEEKLYSEQGICTRTILHKSRILQHINKDSIITFKTSGELKRIELLDETGEIKETQKYKNGKLVPAKKIKEKVERKIENPKQNNSPRKYSFKSLFKKKTKEREFEKIKKDKKWSFRFFTKKGK